MCLCMRVQPRLLFGQQDVQCTQCGSHLACLLGGSDHPARTCQGVSQEGASERRGEAPVPTAEGGNIGNVGENELSSAEREKAELFAVDGRRGGSAPDGSCF